MSSLRRADPKWRVMQVAGDAKWPVSDAWREEHGAALG
jgi:hypothetical protein